MAQATIPFAKHRNAKITWTGKGNPARFHIKVNGPWYFGNWTVVSKSPATGADVLLSSMEEYLEDNNLDHIFSLRTANAKFNAAVGFANEEGVLDFDVMIDANPDYQITGYSTRPSSEARPGAFILKYEKAPEATAYLDDWDEWDDWDPDDDLYSDTYGAQGERIAKRFMKGMVKSADAMANPDEASRRRLRKAHRLDRWVQRVDKWTDRPMPTQKQFERMTSGFASSHIPEIYRKWDLDGDGLVDEVPERGEWWEEPADLEWWQDPVFHGNQGYYGSLLGAAAAWGAKKAVGAGVKKYTQAYATASDPDASPKEKRKAKKFLERIHRRIPASTLSPEAQAANRWLDLFRRESGYPTQEAVEELIED